MFWNKKSKDENVQVGYNFTEKIRDHHRRRPVIMVFIVSLVLVTLAAGSVYAYRALTEDRAVFKSTLTDSNPSRQHLLRVEGSGELVATLTDQTSNNEDKVRYILTFLDSDGEVINKTKSTSPGQKIKIRELVEPSDYTFFVSSEEPLTETGASYTLRIDYPTDVSGFEDKTPPTISIDSPELGADITGSFSVKGVANDNTSLFQVSVKLGDSDTWLVADGTDSWTLNVNSNDFSNGQLIIEVKATDDSGNETIEKTLVNITNTDSGSGSGGDNTGGGSSGGSDGGGDNTGGGSSGGSDGGGDNTGGGSSGGGNSSGSNADFFDDFTQSNWKDRYDFDIFHRDDNVVAFTSWLGDHKSTGPNDLCSAPEEKRTISRGDRNSDFNDDWIYRCVPGGNNAASHLMTSIGDTSGYSIGAFSPKQSFNNVEEVRWDVNITDLGTRQFPEIKIIPEDEFNFQNLPCAIEWLPCDTSNHRDLGSVGTSFFNHEMAINNGNDTQAHWAKWTDSWFNGDDPALESIRTRRTNFFRDNNDGTLTYGIEQEDGSFFEYTRSGSFPSGNVRVVFADHNYTPTKDNPGITFTWHWDDISIK